MADRVLGLRRWSAGLVAWGAASLVVSPATATSLLWLPRPRLIWNASPSSPVGLYSLSSPDALRVGELAVAWAPRAALRLAAARNYLPFHVRLVKRVAAVAGDCVCARQGRILINGRLTALRRRRDPSGRPLPWWSGCTRIGHGQVFLLSPSAPLGFDGR